MSRKSLSTTVVDTSGSVKGFYEILRSTQVLDKQERIAKQIIGTTLKIAKEKFDVLLRDESFVILEAVESGYRDKLLAEIENIFAEESLNARIAIAEVDEIVTSLQESVQQYSRHVDKVHKENDPVTNQKLVFELYEDCRSILTYLRLRQGLLKSFIDTPIEEIDSFEDILKTDELKEDAEQVQLIISKFMTVCLT